jgi:hypothetical protein
MLTFKFDALVNGPRKPIPVDRLTPRVKHLKDRELFWPPAEGRSTMTTEARDALFDEISSVFQLQWGFMDSAKESPMGPEHDHEDTVSSYGASYTNEEYIKHSSDIDKRPRMFVFIDLNEPEMLLRSDIHSVDRMGLEWLLALTVMCI